MNWFRVGALLCGLGVALGAFGAHGLKSHLDADLLTVFETGVRYHMFHALALLAVGWAATRAPGPQLKAAGVLFVVGGVLMPTVCFLAAWRMPLRHLFPLPVIALIGAVVLTMLGGGVR